MLRFTKNHPCFVCGKPDGCAYIGKRENPDAVFCLRIENGAMRRRDGTVVKLRNGMGFVHKFRSVPRLLRPVHVPQTIFPVVQNPPRYNFFRPKSFRSPEGLDALALDFFRCLYSGHNMAVPMYDSRLRVIGYQVRDEDGGKKTIAGGHLGVFLNVHDWERKMHAASPLIVVEGFGDTACCNMGLRMLTGEGWPRAIGRPSNTSGADDIVALCASYRYLLTQVIILPDNDTKEPAATLTQDGANSLAKRLQRFVPTSVACLPDGIKDVRAFAIHDKRAMCRFFANLIH